MGRLFLIVIIMVAVILGIVTVLNKNKNPNTKLDEALQNPSPSPSTSSGSVAGLTSSPLSANTQPSPTTEQQTFPQSTWVTNATSAVIKTNKGEIDIQLYPQDAPKTVTNFATLAKTGYYNNLTFHRVVPGFVIQGGDPNGDGTGGYSIYGPTFEDEFNASSSSYLAGYKEGVVAMANRGPNTNGSQFFIMLADNDQLPKNYTIFGKVTNGMDVVKNIVKDDKMLSITVQ